MRRALELKSRVFVLMRRDPTTVIGGRLRFFVKFWRRLTHDPRVILSVYGVKVPFLRLPVQNEVPSQYNFDDEDRKNIRGFISKLLLAKIVEPVQPRSGQYVSPIFLVTNHDGSSRMILNVKKLNKDFCKPRHFQMETLTTVLPLLSRGVWMASLDLVQGYYNIGLHPAHRQYFCFDFEGVRYQFRALVMGLADSPRIFTKIFRVLIVAARRMGISVVAYLDDTLLWAPTLEKGREFVRIFAQLLQEAGFLIHPDKSVLEPTQRIRFLGFEIDSVAMTVMIPIDKHERLMQSIRRQLDRVRRRKRFTIREGAQFIGFLMSLLPATLYGKAHYRRLERARDCALIEAGRDFDAYMRWPRKVIHDLYWWKSLPLQVGRSFRIKRFSVRMVTDASLRGWGVVSGSHAIHGIWNYDDPQKIDELELLAVLLALKNLPVNFRHAHISLRIDNQVAMAYVNNMGGKVPRLNRVARRIWDFLEKHDAFMVASYVPSHDNVADDLTRLFYRSDARTLDLEARLHPAVFRDVVRRSPFSPQIDWFASQDNRQLPLYCSWGPARDAHCFDAFSHDWGDMIGYFFPPFSLLARVLRKITHDGARGIVIFPWWKGAVWFNFLRAHASQMTLLPRRPDLLQYPRWPGLRHPMRSLRLGVAWIG